MNAGEAQPIDPRAWLVWLLAASLPPLVGRNPFMLAVTLLCVIIVRFSVGNNGQGGLSTSGIVKLAAVFVSIGVVFNVLTVHSGDTVLATIPESLPIVGGEITLNAVVFGVLGGVAILSLVIAGLTVASCLDWATVMRLLPDSFVTMGVAGSIAFAFLPQTFVSFRELREARMIRGAPLRGPRDYASLAAPILASGLDRAVTLSELLETRGLGSTQAGTQYKPWRSIALAIGLAALCAAAYLFAVGRLTAAGGTLLFALAAAVFYVRSAPRVLRYRTRFRIPPWTRNDSIVVTGAALAIAGIVYGLAGNPDAVRYEPYPTLEPPLVALPLLISLIGLLAPAYAESAMT